MMIDRHTYCVIMAGGVGSRFWPMSRSSYPKQFLDFLGTGRTLLQQTYDRFLSVCPKENILVVTNANYADIVKEQLPDIAESRILAEPSRRNTAPCIAYANLVIRQLDPDAVIVVAPSDHLVLDRKAFETTLQHAIGQARSMDCLVTLGIMPNRPDTGYGYIQFEEGVPTHHPKVKHVKAFTEKPDHATAVRFIESGEFVWNAGIFIWSLSSIRKAFAQHLPEMSARFDAVSADELHGSDRIAEVYEACENVSIDYGIMEKARNVFTVLSDFGWSDLGTWGSLYAHLPKDEEQNATIGEDVKLYDCERNIVHAHDGRLMVLQGLEDFIVVSTDQALLVCRKKDEQEIKRFVLDLTAESGDRYV